MLTGALSTLVKNSIKRNFDITFMKNEKNCQNINCFFFFSYKNFFLTGFLISAEGHSLA